MEAIRNYVWYLEARPQGNPQGAAQMGSGVVVSLYQPNQPDSHRRYLLTCRHVIRGADSKGANGYGDPLGEILCWKPNLGFTKPADIPNRQSGVCPGSWIARIADVLSPQSPGDVPADQRHPARDWVLLEVKGSDPLDDFQVEPFAPDWKEVKDGEALDIVGFPGGSATWRTNKLVQSVIARNAESQRLGEAGTLKLNGAQTGPGMSGCGVFDPAGFLAGIHRSATVVELATGAVSAPFIRGELAKLGWLVSAAAADPVAAIRESSKEVSAAFVSLTKLDTNKLTQTKPNTLEELASALETLKADLSTMRDCKAAHEILLHQAGVRVRPLLAAVARMADTATVDEAKEEVASLLDLLLADAAAFQKIAAKCPSVDTAALFAKQFTDAVNRLREPAITPDKSEKVIRMTLQRIVATGPADFQHEIGRKAAKLSFDRISVLVADLLTDRMIPPGVGLEGMMKLIPLKDEVGRLVAEHQSWQDFDREVRPIDDKARSVEGGREADLPDIQYLAELLAPWVQNLQATQTGYSDDFSDLMLSIRAFTTAAAAEKPEPTTVIKTFDAMRAKADYLFNLADQKLLKACESVTTIIAPIETLLTKIS
ncbi:trypsin-like peptidase domain-containing protein [Luteolibacter ambystomatis]|uniref:Trypsin-like peptidase domain-containing protein n=1 Tax=Luteolibacter ambystomatis TaxID=2824561 RepID=A0A975J370_9BACT|nr:serine protease [Luteolibacter ambystomatis]QUE53163.1 trypsin-like peptidase domain-containing protein [Luteolibacter ambystomatis]